MPFSINPKNDEFEVVDDSGKIYGTHPTRRQALDQQRALYANVPDAKSDKAAYDWDKCIADQMEEYGDEETAKKVCGSIRAKYGEYRALSDKERDDMESELNVTRKEAKPSLFERVFNALKEGRRNNNTDAERLQHFHDLSVDNGATCPFIYKQINGKHRWILLSTNSYQDRDGEIVSQQAQEADVERMNIGGNYGPLRLWHIGYPDVATKEPGPGVDIGDCDYSQMLGRVRIESGTFRDERTAAAIGFFHPLDQPDRNGVYADSYTFERSLLPRGKASNYLTPLAAIVKENDMTTKEEKIKQLGELLGDAALADAVLKQVDATEKAAQERGLKFKEAEKKPEEVEKKPEEPDYEAMAKGLAPYIDKMITAKMTETMKEAATKEAGLETAITELTKQVKELTADQPRGFFNGFRPSQSGGTLLRSADGTPVALKEQHTDPVDSVIDQLIRGAQMPFMPSTPTPPKA